MQNNVKARLLLLTAVAIGLLLGGNVRAEVVQATNVGSMAISQQVEQIKQRIVELSADMQRASQQTTVTVSAELTQEKLNYIQSEVTRIAKETARIKVEVEVFVAIRQIQQRLRVLSVQVAQYVAEQQSRVAQVQPGASGKGSVSSATEVEAKIAQIRQQITELTQELEAKKAGGQKVTQAPSDTGVQESKQCSGGSCLVTPTGTQSEPKIVSTPVTTTKTESKGFWQSIGDFIKKLFTF